MELPDQTTDTTVPGQSVCGVGGWDVEVLGPPELACKVSPCRKCWCPWSLNAPTPKHSPNYAPFLLPITGCSSYHHSRRLPSSLPTALLTVCSPFCTAGLSGPQPGLFPSLKRPSPTGSTGSRREVSGRSGYAAVLRAQTRMWVGGGLVLRARMGPRVSSSSSSRSPVGRVALRAPPERPSQETRPGNPLSSGAGGSPYKDERVLHSPGRGGTTGAHEKQREEDRARTAPGAGRNAGIAQVRTHDIPLRCTLNPIIPKTLGGSSACSFSPRPVSWASQALNLLT